MKIPRIVLISLAVLVLAVIVTGQDYARLSRSLSQAKGDYVGSRTCGFCHQDIYDLWFASGHAHKLRPAEEARGAGIPRPEMYTWDDVLWVIGGFKWKARFVGKDGYILTTGGNNQFNLINRSWSDYHANESKPYDCGACHTTNYDASGHQNSLPGVIGTWTFESIQCEECHGPGKEHSQTLDPAKIETNTDSSACGQCHYRTDPNIIPASGGFIRHHEQYNEFLKSGHDFFARCVTCHDPHKTGFTSIKLSCKDCHADVAAIYSSSSMGMAGVTCEDCHMPLMTKSAISLKKWVGDTHTHLFLINLDANAQPFNSDGTLANGYVTSEFACLVCHYDRDKNWAAGYKGIIHNLK